MEPALVFVLIIVVMAGTAVWARRRGGSDAGAPADPDAQVLDQLRRAGSHLEEPHTIEFFVYLPNPTAAESVERALMERGFEVQMERSADDEKWLCLATKAMIPALPAMHEARRLMTELAAKHGGEYDGWGTPVTSG